MPFSEKQKEFFENATHRWNFKVGAVRSGKTYADYFTIPKRIRARVDKAGLAFIFGVSKATIGRNILEPMRTIWGDNLVGAIKQDNTAQLFGETVYCLGCEKVSQVSKIRGASIKYAYGDEIAEWNPEVFELIKSRLDKPYSVFDGACNPESPNHWFKEFLDSAERGVDIYCQNYTIYDNPFLPEEYVHALEAEYAGSVWYDRYILGLWTLAEGLVYPNYTKAIYEEEPDTIPDEYCLSIDYGTSNPFAVMVWERHGSTWYGVEDLYYSGRDTGVQKTDDEYLQMLETLIEPIRDSLVHVGVNIWGETEETVDRIPVIIDPSAASFIALLRQSKYFRPISANNDVLNGIRCTSTALERGIVKISSGCKHWIREAQSYVWDTSCVEDRPVKDFDHLMDATRYFVNTKRLVKPVRPGEYKSPFGGANNDVHLSRFH